VPVAFAGAGIALLPWTIWLSTSLKPQHQTHNWDLAWSGFDTGLAIAFLLTAFAAWHRSPWVEAAAAATGTLLLTDAWFDILLESRGTELRRAILEAVFAELPAAVLCFWVARAAEERLTFRDGPAAPDRV